VPITESFPLWADRGYPASKIANELIVNTYASQYGFELVVLRPANVYGLGHFWSGSSGGQVTQRLVTAGVRGETIEMPVARDFEYVYAKDVGRAVDLAATVPHPAQRTFNVGNGEITSFAELIEAAKVSMPGLNAVFAGGNSDSPKQPMDLSAIKQGLGWTPRYTITNGLADYASELRISLGL
jgi:UDP-glucose 4-epimerase